MLFSQLGSDLVPHIAFVLADKSRSRLIGIPFGDPSFRIYSTCLKLERIHDIEHTNAMSLFNLDLRSLAWRSKILFSGLFEIGVPNRHQSDGDYVADASSFWSISRTRTAASRALIRSR